MPITATENSYEPKLNAGSYPARCYSMIHIGTIETHFEGITKWTNKVQITWEFPTEKKIFDKEKGEQPIVLSKEYTLSMHEKASLRKDLEAWRGKKFTEQEAKSFDITVLLGKPCMINVIHNENNRERISGISPLPKGMDCPPQINKTFEFNYDNFSEETVSGFPQFIQDKIRSSKEYRNILNPEKRDETGKIIDDLPF